MAALGEPGAVQGVLCGQADNRVTMAAPANSVPYPTIIAYPETEIL